MTADLDYIYDKEIYPNIWTCSVMHATSDQEWFFEISDERNDYDAFVTFSHQLANLGARMVGYNNIGFDYPIMHGMLNGSLTTAYDIYLKCQAIITEGGFAHMVWESDWIVEQLDLFKIHHFDNRARSTSLKVLEFNMRSQNIEDLPFEPGTVLTAEQLPVLRHYNRHDVLETKKFYWLSQPQIKMREDLTAKHHKNFINHNDTKIGKDYFIMKLEEAIPGSCYCKDQWNKKQPRQTVRASIDLNTVVFPYVSFEQRPFIGVVDYLKSQKITETKGVFTKINCTLQQALDADHSTVKVLGVNPIYLKDVNEEPLNGNYDDDYDRNKLIKKVLSAAHNGRMVKLDELLAVNSAYPLISCQFVMDSLNCVVSGFKYDFGTGGIHGSVSSQTVTSDATHMIIDIDVASYYPNIAIKNKLYPEHLGVGFCDIYLDVYNQRKLTAKKSPENAMLKLALNGVYGDSNNIYSPFYDPAYTMAITINGQLLLCMLAEQLIKSNELTMIQVNTDGLTVRIPRHLEQWVNDVCDWWERFTLLELERVEYSRMFIRDVNNYIGEFTDDSLKRKGAYAHNRDDQRELPWHKDHGALVVAKAAQAALVDGVDVGDFIRNHNDMMDFMKRAKVPRSSKLVGVRTEAITKFSPRLNNTTEIPLQNITRYYVTDDPRGYELVKIMPPLAKKPGVYRRIGIDVGWKVCPCNNLDHMTAPINYDYYIEQANKLVEPLR